MHTYRVEGDERCTVGHYAPSGEWIAMEEYPSRSAAAERVHWLNGRIHLNGQSNPGNPQSRTGRRSEKGIEARGEARLLRDLELTTIVGEPEPDEFTVTVKENGPPEITCRRIAANGPAAVAQPTSR